MRQGTRRFDQDYFDKWYRHPRHRVTTPAELRRRVAFTVGVAEHLLGRAVRSVLDIGCGEALWRAPLLRLRPRLRYDGVDPSEYVVRRFGRTRNIRHGTFARVGELGLRGRYDIVVCSDVLHYLDAGELRRGLSCVRELLGGIAYLPAFTAADDVEGDVDSVRGRSADWYRARFRAAGMIPLGLSCYARGELARDLAALERPA